MNPAQLSAFFAAHKTAVLGAAAAGVAGLALIQRRKGTAGAGASPVGATAGASVPGTLPAAAVVGGGGTVGGGGYDSTSYDLYNALQPELEQILQTGTSSGAAQAPAPVASTLYAPTDSGKYVSYSNGLYEVESDGSIYHLNPSEAQKIAKTTGGNLPLFAKFTGAAPMQYYGGRNMQTLINKAAGKSGS